MVNPPSYAVVGRILKKLGLEPQEFLTERVELLSAPERKTIVKLNKLLLPLGFWVIDDNSEKITSQIKTALNELLNNNRLLQRIKLSEYLSDTIHYEYHYLSTVFSDFENTSIKKYFIRLKIEKAKDVIRSGSLTFSELAYQLGYSSPAHFTSQFRQVEGKSPSQFRSSLRNQ